MEHCNALSLSLFFGRYINVSHSNKEEEDEVKKTIQLDALHALKTITNERAKKFKIR